MGAPRFSLIVPTCDREDSLRACLEAIARLERPTGDLELIVVDDGGSRPVEPRSLPDTGLAPRVHRQANQGPAGARNAGAGLAAGELLAFVDDDVILSPGWLAAMDRASRSSPTAALGGAARAPRDAGRCAAVSEVIVDLATGRRAQRRATCHGGGAPELRFLPSSNLVLPAVDFDQLGGFDSSFRTAEDRELCRRWRASGRPLLYVPEAGCSHLKRLTLRGFIAQHYRYGRGAFAYQRSGNARGGALGMIEPRFYAGVLKELGSSLLRGELARVGLIASWQLANLAGFAAAALGAEGARRSPPKTASKG